MQHQQNHIWFKGKNLKIKHINAKRPTSSPWAVWNPCKINKALN